MNEGEGINGQRRDGWKEARRTERRGKGEDGREEGEKKGSM